MILTISPELRNLCARNWSTSYLYNTRNVESKSNQNYNMYILSDWASTVQLNKVNI